MLSTSFFLAAVAALITAAVALPAPAPGGYWGSEGQWCDDGYWQYSQGPRDAPFTPWADSYIPAPGCQKPAGTTAPVAQPTNPYSGNDGSLSYTGTATFYYQGGAAGACGTVHSDSDYIAALQTSMYSGGSHCGQKIQIKNMNSGAMVTATVADECPTCSSSTSVDLSDATFKAIGDESAGTMPIAWGFV